MQKIDFYIIKKYLVTFFFTVLLMTIVSIAMDVSERIGKFIMHELGFKEVALDYYLYFIPWINGELWPLFAFLAVIFFTSRMARDSEIIAMLSAGIRYSRVLRPMMIAAGLLAVLHWIGENYVIPHATFHKTEFESKYIKPTLKTTLSNNVQFFIAPNTKIYCSRFNKRDSSLTNFRLEHFNANGEIESVLKANRLSYSSAKNIWTASDYEIRDFDALGEQITYGINEKLDTALNMFPSDFVRHSKEMEILPTVTLQKHIISEQAKGLDNTKRYRIEVYKRTAAPFTILILTLIGATIGTRKVRGGLGMHLAMGLALGAIYTVLSKFSETFAHNLGFPALLGVWLPNILFSILTWYLYKHSQK